MKRDILICIVVISIVIVLNIITSKYTKNSVSNIGGELIIIKEKLEKNKDIENLSRDINQLKENWETRYAKLAYYIEHDELEKVNLYIVGLESNYNSNEYADAIEELNKCEFILKHIEEKYCFSLKNIF